MPKSHSKSSFLSLETAALRNSIGRYRSLVEDSSYGFYCFDAVGGNLLFLNARAGDLLGLTLDDAAGLRIGDLIAPQERPAFRERLKALLAGVPLIPDQFTYTIVRRDCSRVRIEISMQLTEYEGAAVVQGTLKDMTDYEVFQFKLEKAQRLNSFAIMADGIADRLYNAVNVIQQNIANVEASSLASVELLKHIAQIKGAGRQIDRLTQKLLSFSRGGIYRPERLNLNEVLAGLVPLFRHTIKPSIRLKFTPASELPDVVADPTSLQTLLTAVITNADEAIADKGRILICTQVTETDDSWALHNPDLLPGRYVGIGIQDNGGGMDPPTLRRVCEPYFSTKFHGRGLGMAAVYGIIRRHNGWLSIDSAPRRGTRVDVYLPCADLYEQQPDAGQAFFEPAEPNAPASG
jgi:PAS domain S-box-containing protein